MSAERERELYNQLLVMRFQAVESSGRFAVHLVQRLDGPNQVWNEERWLGARGRAESITSDVLYPKTSDAVLRRIAHEFAEIEALRVTLKGERNGE